MARAPKQLVANAVTRRAEELDALDSVLPFHRRNRLAEVLTDEDVAVLRHLAHTGIGENSLRALASDFHYLEVWAQAAIGAPLPWPAPETLLMKFIAHHLWDPVRRESDPAHGMPEDVAEALRSQGLSRAEGPHALSTVRRRLSSWSTLTRWRGLAGTFDAPALQSALKLAVRASDRPRNRKSAKAVTIDTLLQVLECCSGDSLSDLRDRALLLVAFASSGRRSEVASLRCDHLRDEEPVVSVSVESPLPCLSIRVDRSKTAATVPDASVLLVGRPALALKVWLERANITEGPVFRAIDRWGNLETRALTPQAVNLILKRRIAQAGLDPIKFSAHGLRASSVTEFTGRGIPLP